MFLLIRLREIEEYPIVIIPVGIKADLTEEKQEYFSLIGAL